VIDASLRRRALEWGAVISALDRTLVSLVSAIVPMVHLS
jgi:hypothetical protein